VSVVYYEMEENVEDIYEFLRKTYDGTPPSCIALDKWTDHAKYTTELRLQALESEREKTLSLLISDLRVGQRALLEENLCVLNKAIEYISGKNITS
jgi:hypothetical protein